MHRPRHRLLAALLGVAAMATVGAAALVATDRVEYVETHGDSMNPVYYQGDLVVVAKAATYHTGQIIAYRLPGRSVVVLHRIIAGTAAGFVMKGDHNQSIDATKPTAAQVIGRAVLHVSHGGSWLQRLTSPLVLGLAAFLLLTCGTAASTRRRRRQRRVAVARHAAPIAADRKPLSSIPDKLRTAAAGTATVGLFGLLLAGLGWTHPADKPSTLTTVATQSTTFSYLATVPQTAAYDGPTVTFPNPVFRRVTNSVVVRYVYRGTATRVTVDVTLSAPSGWHSTVELPSHTGLSTGEIRLDLNALDRLGAAAARATGISMTPLTVSVVVTAHAAGVKDFNAILPLTLTPLILTPAAGNGAPHLTVSNSTSRSRPATVPNVLHLAGRPASVTTLRGLSILMLLAAAAGGASVLLLLRRAAAASEGDRIRRRYAPLLVTVEPINSPPDRPVIDVTEVAALVRLADRYGLMMLQWTDSGVDTFLVHDDNTTFRYRTGPRPARSAPTGAAPGQHPPPSDTPHYIHQIAAGSASGGARTS
jgi:signal peptidase I